MTPTSTYKMSRSAKTALAFSWQNRNIGQLKRTIIEGELYRRQVVKTKRDKE